VQAAHDDFVRIAGFDLERDLAVFDGDNLRAAMDRLADGRRREVADVQLNTDGTFVRIESGNFIVALMPDLHVVTFSPVVLASGLSRFSLKYCPPVFKVLRVVD
jgi:hypothetical protein